MFQEYPKWVSVDGPGHPDNPGNVLVENADQEAEALATGKGPDHLNPPVDAARAQAAAVAPVAATLAGGVPDKPLAEQSRSELCATLAAILIQSPLSDDEIRSQIEGLQKWLDHRDPDELRAAEEGGAKDLKDPVQPITDAAGAKVPPPQDQEANKGELAAGERTQPLPDHKPETDARPDEAKDREPGTKPATDQIAQAETPPDEKKPPEEGGAKAAKAKAAGK